ncbi:MAG: hypothetical protein AAGG02_19665 [Cyanobacteria bacterium P01_H01_bin.15]
MSQLPFAISTKSWLDLNENEKRFFEDESCLHPSQIEHIQLLKPAAARRFTTWAFSSIPSGFPDYDGGYPNKCKISIHDSWNDETSIQKIREWLHSLGIPLARDVHLIYDFDCVVQTKWNVVVRYWEKFAWSVGYAMTCIDHTLRWACCFHHEDVIVFESYFPLTLAQLTTSLPVSLLLLLLAQ